MVLPDSVTEITNSAFAYCTSLTSINIPDSVTTIGGQAFSYTSLTSFRVPSQISSLESGAGSVLYYCANLRTLSLPNREAIADLSVVYSNLTTINFEGSQSDWISLWDLGGYDDPIGSWRSIYEFGGTINFNTYPSLED